MRKLVFFIIPFLLFFHWFEPVALNVQKGNNAFKNNHYREALDYYLKALRMRNIPEIHFNVGCAFYMLGDYKNAEKEFEKYLKRREDYRAVFNLGNVYYRQGRYKEAIEQYKATLRFNPYYLPAKINLELALQKLQKEEPPSLKPVPDVIMEFLKKKEKEVFKKRWNPKGKSHQKDW